MAEKISTIVLKVDLNCPQCYRKIKKVLCRYHCEIRSHTFDKKQNTVTISGPFDPDCFSRRLCCKAGKSIKTIEIIKQKPVKAPKPDPPPAPKAPEPEPAPPPPKAPEPAPEPPKEPSPPPKKPEPEPKPVTPKEPEPKPVQKIVIVEPVPIAGYPPNFGVCCGPCYQGLGGGPCHQGYGYGRPPTCFDWPPPAYNYDGYYYNGSGRNKCYVNCDYFSEENPTSCTIM